MLRKSLYLSAAVLAAIGSAGAEGQDELRLETVDVAGLRPVATADVTTSVTVLDASALAVRGNPYLVDALRAVPGLGISRSGSAGTLTQVRTRGSEGNHTLVLLDGIEVSDPITGETDFGLFSGAGAGRVEVARGEQSALFGSDAIGGVINILTELNEGPSGLIEAGSRSSYRLDGGYGWALDGGDISVAVSNTVSDGVDTSGLGGEDDGFQNTSGLVRGRMSLGAGWAASGLVRFGYSDVDTDPDLDFDGRLDNADRVTEAEQWMLGGQVGGEAFGLDHAFRLNYSLVERDNLADGALADTAKGERTKLAYSPSYGFVLGSADIVLSGLVDYEREDYSRSDVSFAGGTNQDQSFDTLGVAAEALASFDALTLNASLRRDDNDGRFDDAETWRVGGAYRFDFGGKLRASAGTGVKNPTFTELFGFFPGSFVGNPNLKPEKSTSWEIGWDQTYGDVDWSLTYFEAELEDEIFDDFSVFPFTSGNRAGESERSGVEASAAWRVNEAISLVGAVSSITSEALDGSDELRVPDWTGSLALNWQSQSREGLRAGLAVDYVGEQLDTDFSTFQRVALDPYALVSATLDYPLTERIGLTLRGENLLDEAATDVVGFNGPGAGLFVGLRLR